MIFIDFITNPTKYNVFGTENSYKICSGPSYMTWTEIMDIYDEYSGYSSLVIEIMVYNHVQWNGRLRTCGDRHQNQYPETIIGLNRAIYLFPGGS